MSEDKFEQAIESLGGLEALDRKETLLLEILRAIHRVAVELSEIKDAVRHQ